jgi:hypothetical protein
MNAVTVHLEWVLIPVFATMTGYTDKAIRRKIEEGVWIENKHYRRAPDGRITMNVPEYYKWVEQK